MRELVGNGSSSVGRVDAKAPVSCQKTAVSVEGAGGGGGAPHDFLRGLSSLSCLLHSPTERERGGRARQRPKLPIGP